MIRKFKPSDTIIRKFRLSSARIVFFFFILFHFSTSLRSTHSFYLELLPVTFKHKFVCFFCLFVYVPSFLARSLKAVVKYQRFCMHCMPFILKKKIVSIGYTDTL